MRQIADLVTITEHELAIFGQLFRVGIFVNAIDRRDCALFQFPRDRFVGREHEFFDQLMRFIVLDPLQSHRFALLVDADFHFREIKIERAVLEAFLAAETRRAPRRRADVRPTGRRAATLQNRVGLACR